jgi:hypothetical protein
VAEAFVAERHWRQFAVFYLLPVARAWTHYICAVACLGYFLIPYAELPGNLRHRL